MYELKDSYFVIFNTKSMVIVGAAIALAVTGVFFLRNKRRGNNNGQL